MLTISAAFPGAIGIDNDEKIAGLAKSLTPSSQRLQSPAANLPRRPYGRPKTIGGRTPVGPSAVAAPRDGAATPVALTAEEVEGMIGKFGEAVRRAIQAGFDGVEIHGANTYLIQQFFSPNSNQRDDEWGGSRENRAKFPLAVLDITHKMVRQYADDAFIIGYRFSPEELEVPGIRFEDTLYLLEKLAARGWIISTFPLAPPCVLLSSILRTRRHLSKILRHALRHAGSGTGDGRWRRGECHGCE